MLRCILFFVSILCFAMPVKAQNFTMAEAVLYALEHNPTIDNAKQTVLASTSAKKAARSSFGPSVSVAYDYQRYSIERSSRERNVASVSAKLSQPLFTGFNLLNTYQKAALQNDNDKLSLISKRLSLTANVQSAFIDYIEALESIRSAKRTLERAKNQREMTKLALEIGLRPKLDFLQAEVDLADAEAKLIKYENRRDVIHAKLATLLGLPSNVTAAYVGDLTIHAMKRSLDTCIKLALDQKPEMHMAYKSIQIAYKDLGIAKSAFWPQLSAVIEWTTSGSHINAAGNKFTPKNYSYADFGISINWNVFSSGKTYHLTQQAKHKISALESSAKDTISSIGYAVRSSLLSAQDAFRAIKVAERALVAARESYENAKMRYETQSCSYIDLLTAQASYSSAELSEISSRADCLRALSLLYQSMGELHPDLKEDYTIIP